MYIRENESVNIFFVRSYSEYMIFQFFRWYILVSRFIILLLLLLFCLICCLLNWMTLSFIWMPLFMNEIRVTRSIWWRKIEQERRNSTNNVKLIILLDVEHKKLVFCKKITIFASVYIMTLIESVTHITLKRKIIL